MEDKKFRKILVIDDSHANLFLLKVHLQKMGLVPLLADNGPLGLEMAIDQQPDVILLDVMMPEMDGFEVCKKLKADGRTSKIPIIFVSAKTQAVDKVAGLEVGAIDYISKPYNRGELIARIDVILNMVRLQEQLLDLANTDDLTKLANRRNFFEVLDREVLKAKFASDNIAVLMLDIDNFKLVNDTYGHQSGDEILRQMGKILRENIYPVDVAARYGGEEFVVLMMSVDSQQAIEAAERLRSLVGQRPWEILGKQITVTVSIGVADIDLRHPFDSHDLIRRADMALYAAKHSGRNCVVYWDHMDENKQLSEAKNQDYEQLQDRISSQSNELQLQAIRMISSFTETMATKDPRMVVHSENVCNYAIAISKEMGLSKDMTVCLGRAGLLHDLGKIGVPDDIIRKTSRLNEQEEEFYRQHPVMGVQILEPLGIFSRELSIIRHHHENFDGTGYPDGLAVREIPMGARILAVANEFDNICSGREYRVPASSQDAINEIVAGAGTKFDPEVVDAFKAVGKKNNWPLSLRRVSAGSEFVKV